MESLENASTAITSKFCGGVALQRKTRVAEHRVDLARALRNEGELGSRNVHHQGIDVVDAAVIALARVGGESAGSEADHAVTDGSLFLQLLDGQPTPELGP